MPTRRIQRTQFVCLRCDFEWFPRGGATTRQTKPKQCPNCKRYNWDRDDYKPKPRGRAAKKAKEAQIAELEQGIVPAKAEVKTEKGVVGHHPTVENPALLKKQVSGTHVIERINTPYVPEEERA